MRRAVLSLSWLLLLAPVCLVASQAVAGPAAPAPIDTEVPRARLAGAGTFRYFGLQIYDAQFWVGPNGYRATAPRAERFALDLHYTRSLNGKKIATASTDEMKKLGLGTAVQHADWQARMEKIFPDVKEGTRITGIYLPDEGARFYRDGKPLGEIGDPAFGHAFFAIWLDPKTTGGALREALLADAGPQ
ncbi:MAG: chalcone isomerase family protein [Herminiimonas sp.]|nr:chalcone isomerase family protein [Herminiimonas sp.]